MSIVLILNGIYDIACASAILFWTEGFFAQLHIQMFTEQGSCLLYRMRAYWLYTYGIVRLVAGLALGHIALIMAVSTYVVEAMCFEYEAQIEKTMVLWKVHCSVILCCVIILLASFAI